MKRNPSDGFNYIFHVADNFSRFNLVAPLREKSALEVLDMLKYFIFKFSISPKIIQLENGRKFANRDFIDFASALKGRDPVFIAPKNSLTNGIFEQAHGKLYRRINGRNRCEKME
ncbi:hypothetical protein AYI68_g6302 [Smittium mucronatum]|uniref:Integrase catalytic domain-containing protein n=1 Tax=Smittium mucronatum TaxID=133383 RepID=A0A1R0GRU4_9FUNG|nr:hypothetical protein AYI68_g6302 [Smittium mucronatum]